MVSCAMGLFVRAFGFVIENVDRAVARLQEIDVAGHGARHVTGGGLCGVYRFPGRRSTNNRSLSGMFKIRVDSQLT